MRASWRPQGRGASFRSDLQALDAARGGHVAAVLAGEARDGHVLAALAVSGCHLVAGRSGHLAAVLAGDDQVPRSAEHTSELQSLMRISYAVFCLKKNK